MVLRKLEVIKELGVNFLNELKKGDSFGIKAINKENIDIVSFHSFDDISLKFYHEDELYGIFFQEIRDNKVKLHQID